MQFLYPGWLTGKSNIDVVDCGLQKGKDVDKGFLVCQVEHIGDFKEFINSTQGAGSCKRGELFVYNHLEIVVPPLDPSWS